MGVFCVDFTERLGEKQTGNEAVVIGIDFLASPFCHFIQRKGERKSG